MSSFLSLENLDDWEDWGDDDCDEMGDWSEYVGWDFGEIDDCNDCDKFGGCSDLVVTVLGLEKLARLLPLLFSFFPFLTMFML